VLLLCGVSSNRGTDIGELAPVEVVWLSETAGQIYLETDTGDMGHGDTIQAALTDMKAAAPGTIFLETADYLIVEPGSEILLEQLYDILRPSCKVCAAQLMPNMKLVAAFLNAHEPQVTLRQYQVETCVLPLLGEQEGRFVWNAE
jgi:hypothetical protein